MFVLFWGWPLRIVETNFGRHTTELPTRFLPPGNLTMLFAQFDGNASYLD